MHQYQPDLSNLIRFCQSAGPLQVDELWNALAVEAVMAASYSLAETKLSQYLAKVIKTETRIAVG